MQFELKNLHNKIFSYIKIIWPIEVHEIKKFLPTAFLMFFILFNYNILRSLKDSLVIVSIGAESISFLKLWGVLPVAITIMLIYAKLVNLFKEEKVFYIFASFFILYFLSFQFYLKPNSDLLHPDPIKIKELAFSYPFAKYFFYIYGKWIYASFYIMSEMWGSTMLSLLFWQFANKITTTEESKRFYPMITFIANTSLVISGSIIKYFSDTKREYNDNKAVMDLVLIVITFCLIIISIYRYMHVKILTDPVLYTRANQQNKPHKERLSLKESFKLISHSKYLGLIAVMVISYGFAINLVEGPWKAKIKLLCPTEIEYAHFMGNFTFIKGLSSLLFVIIGSYFLRKLSWLLNALVTPIVFLISGLIFFMLCIFQNEINQYTYVLVGIESLGLVVTIGTIQNVLSRSVTFSFFDPTKEIAYIPLNKELKTKGKAAVDIVGSRLGKSGSALIQSIGLTIFHTSSLITAIPYLAFIYFIVSIVWIKAVISLNLEYTKLINKK